MLWWFELCSPDSFKFRLSICCCAKVWWRCLTPHYSRLSCGWETPLKELPKALSLFCVSSEIRATHFYGWTFITLSICTCESLLSFQHMNNALGSYIKHAGGMQVKANRCSCAPVLWDPVLVQCQSQMGRKPCQLASIKRFCFSMAMFLEEILLTTSSWKRGPQLATRKCNIISERHCFHGAGRSSCALMLNDR